MTDSAYIPDSRAVASYLERSLPGLLSGELSIELIAGGRSNLTYTVTDGIGHWVLRRPPLGHVLTTAHDMAREYRVMAALSDSAVPVPHPVVYCDDDAVIGAPWYLMQQVAGHAYSSASKLSVLGPELAGAAGERLVDTLVALHAVDVDSVGLGDFGKPAGYLVRQLDRWQRQLDASRSRDIEGIDALHVALATALPESQAPTILHGDYRLGNVLLTETADIAAVLDWEMATLGDPLADVGLLVMYSTVDNLVDGGGDPADVGFPSATSLVERYRDASQRDVSALPWYVAFSYFKLAVIIEGIHYRFTQGQTVGAGFERMGSYVAPLVAAGTAALRGQ